MQLKQINQENHFSILIDKMDALIRAQNDNSNLWNAERCAEYFNCSIGHFKCRIAPKPDFPKPVKLNQTSRSLWFPQDVKAYAKRKQLSIK